MKKLPVEGKAIRFAPGRNQEPAASFWKVWAEGSEIYASTRSPGGAPKISVHASGQIHYRLEAKAKQDVAPLMRLGSGPWLHAFELRFLLSDGALSPFKQRESLKNKSAHLIRVPDGFVLYANLIIGPTGTPLDCPLPAELAGQTLWRTRLRDGRCAVLVTRLLELDDQNLESIRYFRTELKPTATLSSMSSPRYMEIYNFHWSAGGGNVVLVVPMGDEAFLSEQDLQPDSPSRPRQFRYQTSRSTVELTASNGMRVAIVELADLDKQIELIKGAPKTVELGLVTMRLEPGNLIAGSPFILSPRRIFCSRNIGGASPLNSEYMLRGRFGWLLPFCGTASEFDVAPEQKPCDTS